VITIVEAADGLRVTHGAGHGGGVVLRLDTTCWKACRYRRYDPDGERELQFVLAQELASSATRVVAEYGLDEDPERVAEWLAMAALSKAEVPPDHLSERLGSALSLVMGLESGKTGFVAEPMRSLRGGAIRYELLCRRGRLRAGRMIRDAEWAGLSARLDRAVIRQAVQLLAALADTGERGVVVHVNVSNPTQALGIVAETIEATGVDPRRLCLELTEGQTMDKIAAENFVRRARERGLSVVSDDMLDGPFPAFAWLSKLSELGLAGFKVSDLFKQAATDRSTYKVLKALIAQAHDRHMLTVAEWVKDREAWRLAEDLGFDYVQGSFAGLGMSAAEMIGEARNGMWSPEVIVGRHRQPQSRRVTRRRR
jgi:EAL domain-containing protein (putative c-di-GMP-specific phosphodiesterase class I)